MSEKPRWSFTLSRRTAALVAVLAAALVSCGHAKPDARSSSTTSRHRPKDGRWRETPVPRRPSFTHRAGAAGGYISNTDEAAGETWYFQAPATVLSQLAAAEGGRLAYSLKQDSADAGFPDDDVVIVGPAGRLSYRFDYAPGTDWTDFSVPLSASANWRWNWNARATPEQIRTVLSRPLRLEIRGEYRTGDDMGGMDHFVLTAGN